MVANSISVRLAVQDDADCITDFNCGIARETEDKELDRSLVLSGVKRGIDRAPEVRYFLAEDQSKPVGCLMITREWSDWRDGWLIWIQSVYVSSEYRGQGVFKELLAHLEDTVRSESDVVGLRLYVEVENDRAQEVYGRTGFIDPNYKVLEKLF